MVSSSAFLDMGQQKMSIKGKNIRAWPVEIDKDWIWFSDNLVGGLYRYHIPTGETRCEINPVSLYDQGVFRVGGIVSWEEYVIICPLYVGDPIIVFSKQTKSLKNISINLNIKEYAHFDSARKIGSRLYLNLYRSSIAALVMEMEELCSTKIKTIIPQMILYPHKKICTTWWSKYFKNTIYFPVYGEKKIYKIENEKISCLNAQIPENIYTIYFYKSEIWVLSIAGDEVYRIDLNGKLQEVISIKQHLFLTEKSKAYNIIVTENYIFFMLWTNVLVCYDRKKHCEINLDISLKDFKNQYPDKFPGNFLYGIERKDKLILLPYGNRGLEINLLTLECNTFDILFPDKTGEEKIIDYKEIAFAHRGGKLFSEIGMESLNEYLKYINRKNVLNISDKKIQFCTGKKIYQTVNK